MLRIAICLGFLGLLPSVSSAQENPAARQAAVSSFAEQRKGFSTHLIKQESEDQAPEQPPEGVFDLIRYPSPAGDFAAYVSSAPKDGKKHPLVIWLTGGFDNSISSLCWENQPLDNDQSASAYRKAGIPMMYPSLRGGNDNPGHKEALFGEVDDVLAAVQYASKLPWVDTSRIYLGGHSTGGTLALLVAAAAPEKTFRAVISFGPIDEVAGYGQKNLPFDIKNEEESRLRAPVHFLSDIDCPLFVMEGGTGNVKPFEVMRKLSSRGQSFVKASHFSHFSLLAPANAVLASEIVGDVNPQCSIRITEKEIDASFEKIRDGSYYRTGDVRESAAVFGLVFYYSPQPASPPAAAFRALVKDKFPGVPVVTSFKEVPAPPFIMLTEEQAPLENYPVPNEGYFKFAGRGLTSDDIKAIQQTRSATIAVLVSPAKDAWQNAKIYNELALTYAEQTKACIWDSATRECFSREAWKDIRIDGWAESKIANIRSQITIHCYPREDGSGHLRAITLGMEKFALPDVAVESLVSSDNNSVGNLINAFCQTIAINPVINDPKNFIVQLSSIEPVSERDYYQKGVREKGTGKATLAVMEGIPSEGDTDNAQMRLDFRHGVGTTDDERRTSLLSGFWGVKDPIIKARHNEAIEAASKAAKQKFLGFKKQFRDGLPPGSRLMVKGPFKRDDEGNEWMWIELLEWKDNGELSGLLQNDPYFIKTLKAGARVTIREDEIFDYIYYRADGTSEGNATAELLEKSSKE